MLAIVFLLWIFFSFFVAAYAGSKKVTANPVGSFIIGFLISIIFSPLIGFIAVAVTKPNQKALEREALVVGGMKKCPKCAELIKKEATVCRFCSFEFKR